MRTMLVAGTFSRVLDEYDLDIVNKERLSLEQLVSFCQRSQLRYEQILVTDDGMIGMDIYSVKSVLTELSLFQEKENRKQPIVIITNHAYLSSLGSKDIRIEMYYSVRIPIKKYLDAVIGTDGNADSKKAQSKAPSIDTVEKRQQKKSLIERLRKEKTEKVIEPIPDREYEMISREISRVIAITGHRGSGVTSTTVNLAQIANNKNLSTIVIDLDTVNCAFNLYFSEYYELAEKSQDIACSLIRNLAKPHNYYINSHQQNNLNIVTLAYSFSDESLLERFFTSAKLVNMLTVFRKHFQLCLLDMPLQALERLKEAVLYIDAFGLCVSNNLYSLTSTLRGFQHIFTQEEIDNIYGKSAVIVSKYNEHISIQDEFFSPEKVCDLLLELSDIPLSGEFALAGHIPHHRDFDTQLETDIPIIATDAHMEKAYSEILLRLIKGAGKL